MANEPETRDCTIRNVSGGFRTLCLVHDEDTHFDPGEVATVKMNQVELKDAIDTKWFEPVAEGEGSDDDDDLADEIRDALDQLDHENDEHWNADGKPAMKAIEALVGKNVARKQVDEVDPGLERHTQ